MSPSLRLEVYSSPTRTMLDGKSTFSPVTSTIVLGSSEAVLVDAQFVDEDIDAVANLIDQSGRRLRTIFVTHGHVDHYFGLGRLLERFPDARAVATPGVVDYIDRTHDGQVQASRQLLGGLVTEPTARPQALDGDALEVDGERLAVIEVGQGDIAPSTVLHVPALAALIVGDVAYNGIHQMLAYSTPREWDRWIESLDAIERLEPEIVVAGHRMPDADDDDVRAIIGGSRDYIRDFATAVEASDSARQIVATMRDRYPDRGNLTTLIASAAAATR